MRIAILGSGLMGSALGTAWAGAGHTVAFSYSRDAAKLDALARDADGATASPNDAVRGAEVVLVSVPWHRLEDALAAAGGTSAFAGKVVVSCSLPMLPDDSDLAIAHVTSGAETLAEKLRGARVVSAFNTIPSEIIRTELLHSAAKRGEQPQVVICGDDVSAKDAVAHLATDIGFIPVDAGPLRISRYTEPFALLVAQLAYAQDLGPALGYRFLPEHHDRTRRDSLTRDTPPFVIAEDGGSGSIATVSVYGPDDLDPNAAEVARFKADALQFVKQGVAVAAGTSHFLPGVLAPIGTFTFGEEQRPLPFEEVLEWLRTVSIVRLIEVEWQSVGRT